MAPDAWGRSRLQDWREVKQMVHIKNRLTRLSDAMQFMAQQSGESTDHTQDDYSDYR
jgi:hypothetical protein